MQLLHLLKNHNENIRKAFFFLNLYSDQLMQISRAASVFKTEFKSKLSVFSWTVLVLKGGGFFSFFSFFLISGVESHPVSCA